MKPAVPTFEVTLLHPVVAQIDHAGTVGSQTLQHSVGDQFAIRGGPMLCMIMTREVPHGRVAARGKAAEPELFDLLPENRFTQTARPAVDTQVHAIGS